MKRSTSLLIRCFFRTLSTAACLLAFATAPAFADDKTDCDPAKTPSMIDGTVTAVSGDRITVRLADGSTHEFQVGKETAQGYKAGDRIKARLRTNPKCDGK
ncbi:MAG TPA: hypothetical protein VFW68_00965 [Rhodocyclaceae bacterium]|nr:hypothetical protein [Rhodocyclaceae bacterium]